MLTCRTVGVHGPIRKAHFGGRPLRVQNGPGARARLATRPLERVRGQHGGAHRQPHEPPGAPGCCGRALASARTRRVLRCVGGGRSILVRTGPRCRPPVPGRHLPCRSPGRSRSSAFCSTLPPAATSWWRSSPRAASPGRSQCAVRPARASGRRRPRPPWARPDRAGDQQRLGYDVPTRYRTSIRARCPLARASRPSRVTTGQVNASARAT